MKKLIAISLTSMALIASMSAPARADHAQTIVGAVIGTTVGTVIGSEVGGHRGSIIGAVIGAATGATIGHDVGYRHRERVEYERVYYPQPVYRYPQPVERVVYVPVERPVAYLPQPYPRDYDDCDDRDWKRGRHRHGGHRHRWD